MRKSLLFFIFVLLIPFVVAAQENAAPSINLSGSFATDSLFLVDDNGMSLYLFTEDTDGTSVCYDDCAEAWPPLVADEIPEAPAAIAEKLSLVERTDGTMQVAYDNMPLYYFANDEKPGDINGHEAGDVWYLVEVDALHVIANEEVGPYLVAPDGMALYIFTEDEAGVSNCTDDCADAWPPMTVESADAVPAAPAGVAEKLSVIERTDGTFQVAYDEMPLYLFMNDEAPGDTTGQGAGDVWYVVEIPTAITIGSSDDLGDFIADSAGMTLYIFTEDEAGVSNCVDGCAEAWPPLTIEEGEFPVAHFGVQNAFGVIERADGTLQVTYFDLPLYYFMDDATPGDANGQGAGDVWFIVPVE